MIPQLRPEEIKALREALGVTQSEFGAALNLADPGRTVRAWESGSRNGREFGPSSTALAAIHYLVALKKAFDVMQFNGATGPYSLIERALPSTLMKEKATL